MRVLGTPIIWILVAVVLVVLAAALIVAASVRRSQARRRAAAWGPAAALEPARPAPGPDGPRAAFDPETVPIDLSAARVTADPEDADPEDADTRAPERSVPAPATAAGVDTTAPPTPEPSPTAAPVEPAVGPETPVRPPAHDVAGSEPLAAPLFRPWTMQTRLDAPTGGDGPARPARHAAHDQPVEPVLESEAVKPAAEEQVSSDSVAEVPAAEVPAAEVPAAEVPAAEVPAAEVPAAEVPAAEVPASEVPASEPTTGPEPASGETAKDRLLAVLLRDPEAALTALAGAEGRDTASAGQAAASLLRAGLTPPQVARLVGVSEGDLASHVARGLGLLARPQGTGESRTDDPGRSWANAGSTAGSTTPTTG